MRSARRQAKTPTQEERIAVNKPERAFASLDDLSHSLRQLLLQSPEFASLTSDEQDAKLDEYMQQLKSDLYSRIGAVTVQNKFDLDERVHLNAEALQRKFPFFIDNISVSVLVGTRMDYLENILLAELFEQLDLVGEIYPGTYPKVIEKIAKRNAFQLKLDDIRELYRGVLDEYSLRYEDDRFDNFLTYAQSIGRILFFPEWEEIKDIVFSQPHQMLQRFYAILNDKLEHPRGDCAVGEFDRDYALNAIRQSFYKGKARRQKQSAAEQEADAILKLMLRFHVVFQPDPTEACYIAPQYLPAQPHRTISFVRDTFSKPLYRYVYQGFIHTSIILHFYSEYGQHAEKEYPEARSASDYLFWKDGIFIRKGADLVLVEFDRKRYRVNIYPKSELKRNPLIDEIVTTLDRISSGRSFQKQVSADGEHFIPLDILEARAERGIPWLEFEGKIHRLGEFREFVQQQYPMKKIFISYSSADLAYVEELKAHLSVLQRNNLVDTWYDRKIVPGQEWDKKIKDELHSADIILLLVSSDFLHSDYIWDIEVRAAVEMHKQGEAKVIPVILRSCLWEGRYSPFSTLQSPRKGAPLDLADNKDQAWKEIIQGVVNVIDGKDVDAQAEPTS